MSVCDGGIVSDNVTHAWLTTDKTYYKMLKNFIFLKCNAKLNLLPFSSYFFPIYLSLVYYLYLLLTFRILLEIRHFFRCCSFLRFYIGGLVCIHLWWRLLVNERKLIYRHAVSSFSPVFLYYCYYISLIRLFVACMYVVRFEPRRPKAGRNSVTKFMLSPDMHVRESDFVFCSCHLQ